MFPHHAVLLKLLYPCLLTHFTTCILETQLIFIILNCQSFFYYFYLSIDLYCLLKNIYSSFNEMLQRIQMTFYEILSMFYHAFVYACINTGCLEIPFHHLRSTQLFNFYTSLARSSLKEFGLPIVRFISGCLKLSGNYIRMMLYHQATRHIFKMEM